jgi:hypothetical protein
MHLLCYSLNQTKCMALPGESRSGPKFQNFVNGTED